MYKLIDLYNFKCAICGTNLQADDNYSSYYDCSNNCITIHVSNVSLKDNISAITYRIYNNDDKTLRYSFYTSYIDGFKIYLNDMNGSWYNSVPVKYFNILLLSLNDMIDIINKYEKAKILK